MWVLVQVQIELLQPYRIQRFVDYFRFVLLCAQTVPEIFIFTWQYSSLLCWFFTEIRNVDVIEFFFMKKSNRSIKKMTPKFASIQWLTVQIWTDCDKLYRWGRTSLWKLFRKPNKSEKKIETCKSSAKLLSYRNLTYGSERPSISIGSRFFASTRTIVTTELHIWDFSFRFTSASRLLFWKY